MTLILRKQHAQDRIQGWDHRSTGARTIYAVVRVTSRSDAGNDDYDWHHADHQAYFRSSSGISIMQRAPSGGNFTSTVPPSS
jgi:hypothetical protein